ncbi:MAG: hypothetical protein RL463_720 [Bacteroidota bacterium]|jgi:hypothetical protein
MKNWKKKTLAEKVADINGLWDNEEKYLRLMPNREMYCHFIFDDSDDEDRIEICEVHPDDCCILPDPTILNEINLDSNTDWLSWELEMME